MKNFITLYLLLLSGNFLGISQNITLSFANSEITNDGVDDFYEVDVFITSDTDYIQGSGQFFIDYNTAAFGINIQANGGITYERPTTSILGSTTVGVENYNSFVVNDNITSRVSFLWQQFWSSGAIGANNVTGTPALLVHIKMKYIDSSQSSNVCFDADSNSAFNDQFFTACGPTTFAGADCFNFPGTQIFDYVPDCSGAVISCLTTTTWDGAIWDNGIPDTNKATVINANYDTSLTSESIDACKITINTGVALTISDGYYLNVENDITVDGTLFVLNGGSLVQVDDTALVTNNGSITVEKITPFFTDQDFSIMGSPMSGETREGVYNASPLVRHHLTGNFTPHPQVAIDDPGAENFADDNGNNWLAHTGTLTVGEGYLVKPFFNGSSGVFTTNYTQGTLNNGEVNFTALYGDNQNDSPNILANPYASSVDAFVFITDNAVVDAIYYWEHITATTTSYPGYNSQNYDMGDISMYNLSGGVAAANAGGGVQASNQYIPSGQGFAVKANAAGTVTFNNTMRLINNNAGYRNSESIDRLYLSLSNETYNLKNSTLVAFTEDATDGFDRNYDSKRLATPISLYSLNSDRELGIQGRSVFTEYQEILLGFTTHVEENQEYTISINSIEGELLSQATVYLKDSLLNTVTNLSETAYTFTSVEGHQLDRFVIVFTEGILGNQDLEMNTLSVYPNPTKNILNIVSPQIEIMSVEVFDLRGRKVNSLEIDNQTNVQVDMSILESALYFIKIITENGSVIKRVVKE